MRKSLGATQLHMRRKAATRSRSLEDLISQAQAARIRGVTRAAIRDLIRRGRLIPVEIAGRLLLHKTEVENFEKRTPGPKPDAQVEIIGRGNNE